MKRKQPTATTTSKLSKIVPPTPSSGAMSVGDPLLNAAATDGNATDDLFAAFEASQEPKKKKRNRGGYLPASPLPSLTEAESIRINDGDNMVDALLTNTNVMGGDSPGSLFTVGG